MQNANCPLRSYGGSDPTGGGPLRPPDLERPAVLWTVAAPASSAWESQPCHSRAGRGHANRSEEHTSELQSQLHLVCRLLLEKKKPEQARRSRPANAAHSGISVHLSDEP